MTTEENEEARSAHNDLAEYVDSQLVEKEFNRLKNLFSKCPIKPKDMPNIRNMTELFQQLESDEKISVGDYKYFTKRLESINRRLATEVEKRETEIKQMLNRGPSECSQERARYESHQPPTGNPKQRNELVPLQETKEGTAGNFHRNEKGLSFTDIEALGKSDLRKSIGIIKIKKDGRLSGSGTGFRVGRNYLMTAYHVLDEIIKSLWKLALRKAGQSNFKQAIYQEIQQLFEILPDKIEPDHFKPSQQPLPFGKLFEYLHKSGEQTEVFDTVFKQAARVEFGMKDGKATAGEFYFEYNIPFADEALDVLVLEIVSEGDSILPPSLPLEEDSIRELGHLIGYPIVQTEVDLWSDVTCNIYTNNRYNELQKDVTKAIKWWKDERNLLVEGDYAVCRNIPKTNCSATGEMFLHSSKVFEYRSSGSPIFAIIHDRPVVQLMYLRGYPEFCYAERNFPPPQYLFEAGVAMPVITQLLRKRCPNIMEK